jgi:hypothetical protein
VGIPEIAEGQHGVPSDMSRITSRTPDSGAADLLVAADVLMRQEPDEEEDDEEDDGNGKKNDDDNDEDGYFGMSVGRDNG